MKTKKFKTNKERRSKQPVAHERPLKYYGPISLNTIRNLIGDTRVEALLNYIESKHGTRKILLGYHTRGCGGHVYLTNPYGKCLGPLADILIKSDRKVKHSENETEEGEKTKKGTPCKSPEGTQRANLRSKRTTPSHD